MIQKARKSFYLIAMMTLFWSLGLTGQIKMKVLDTSKLPVGVSYEGEIKHALRWTDKLGDNIIIATETGIYQSEKFKHENEGSDAELFAYHFIISNNIATQTWRLYDFVSDCPVDIEARFIKNTVQVTDLNKDGMAEIWVMYKTACHGDVSPCDMKIIMYHGQQKYAMRGQNKVAISENEFYGGEYKFDNAFSGGPKEFRDFAKKLWNKNIMQKWDE